MRSRRTSRKFVLIFAVSIFLIIGLDLFVPDNGIRGRGLKYAEDTSTQQEAIEDLIVDYEASDNDADAERDADAEQYSDVDAAEQYSDADAAEQDSDADIDAEHDDTDVVTTKDKDREGGENYNDPNVEIENETVDIDEDIIVSVEFSSEAANSKEGKKNIKPIMHTFYEAVPNGCCGMSKEGHEDLLAAWKMSWEDRGWETVVLTEEDARKHPDFESLNQKLMDLDVNDYNRRCYWRWLAIVSVGGGWMSDYDVFPLSLNGEIGLALEQSDTFSSYAYHIPCLIHASAKEWDRILHLMIDLLPDSPEEVYERVTDMYSLLNIDIEQGRSGMQWTSEVAPHFTYHRNEEGWQWMDCNFGWKHFAIHISHHECAKAFKTDHYPEIDDVDSDTHGLPNNVLEAVQRRSEAALKVMDDYKEHCMLTSSGR